MLGILNVTPDSFSDGGRFVAVDDRNDSDRHERVTDRGVVEIDHDQAIDYAIAMAGEGADIIDVGGESTRPGAVPVSTREEMSRVIPIIEALGPHCRISVDTRHEQVARAAVAAGASIINDISASLWPVAADLGVGWIAMHMQGDPSSMQRRPVYGDVLTEVKEYLVERATQAIDAGVPDVWIDPGFGFGKTLHHNLRLLAGLDQLVATGLHVAVGTSRKAMLGHLIARSDGGDQPAPVGERLVGSIATATYAMLQGVDLVRVHDVKAAKQAATVVAGRDDQE